MKRRRTVFGSDGEAEEEIEEEADRSIHDPRQGAAAATKAARTGQWRGQAGPGPRAPAAHRQRQQPCGKGRTTPTRPAAPKQHGEQRRALPIHAVRSDLLAYVDEHDTCIVVGETGSGKTTQLPQFLREHGACRSGGAIACTQPRRVAAVTVAQRVAEEAGSRVGQAVGYTIRFDNKSCDATEIKYLTDGMMLREAMFDPLLSVYSVIILDEAHERTLHTDVLLSLLRRIQSERKARAKTDANCHPLKLVIMSATLEASVFSNFFMGAPILYIVGRQYPVEIFFTRAPHQDYLHAALVATLQIHQDEEPGDILVFLSGQSDIESMAKLLQDAVLTIPEDLGPLDVRMLYGALPPQEQLKVFEPAPTGTRKAILATNIAETSVTINGIRYVVDTGVVKARTFNPRTGLETLAIRAVSKAQAKQRSGRAGRESAGKCFRLYTESSFSDMAESTEPEIVRCNLSSVALQLFSLNINPVEFEWAYSPTDDAQAAALELLYELEALGEGEDGPLTVLGAKMARFPLEPTMAKAILSSEHFACLDELITIVALLSVENPFYVPTSLREKADKAKKKFASADGDHSTLLNVFRSYQKMKGDRQFCYDHFINVRAMRTVVDIRAQLEELCERQGLAIVSCGEDTTAYRKCLLLGLFNNVAVLQPDGVYKVLKTGQRVGIHPGSVLFGRKPQCVLYTELVKTAKPYIRNVSTLDPAWLHELKPRLFKSLLPQSATDS